MCPYAITWVRMSALGYHPPDPRLQAVAALPSTGTHPPGRVGKERLHRELGCAEQRSLHTESRWDDSDESARGRERPSVELCFDGRRHERMDPPEQTAEHDERGIERLTRPATPIPSQWPSPRVRSGRPGSRPRHPPWRRPLPAAAGRPAGAQQEALADLGLPAADRAAPAGEPHRVDRHVADLAAVAGRSGQRFAVDDDPAADAVLAGDEQDVASTDGGTPTGSARAPRSASFATEIGTSTPNAAASASPRFTSTQPRFGAIETTPSLRRTTPTTATPTPTAVSSGRLGASASASSARSAAIASTDE